jgi:2-(1,2-epoxy-1,2-dihydrophenyl)acetyl-CoA isomerase
VGTEQGEEVLLESVDRRVGIVTLNRPDSLNALNVELMRRLVESLTRMAEDDTVRCVVLTGSGRGFCPGGDRGEIGKSHQQPAGAAAPRKSSVERRARWLRRSAEAARLLCEMPKVSIAMINGACAGAGLSLAAACDFRFAAASAKFASAFVPYGVSGDYGGSWLWTRILGTSKARQLYLLDERRTAEQALAFGLIDRIYDDADLVSETMTTARQLADLAPAAVAYAKANLNAALTETLSQSLDRESLNMMLGRAALNEARKIQPQERAPASDDSADPSRSQPWRT